MKIKLLIFFLTTISLLATAQSEKTVTDTATASIILQKHLKSVFLKGLPRVKRFYVDNASMSPENEYAADYSIRMTIPAIGKSYMEPDYTIHEEKFSSPLGFDKLYKLEIPYATPRNDSIAGYNVYRDIVYKHKFYGQKEEIASYGVYDYWERLRTCIWLTYNPINGNIEYLSNEYTTGGCAKKQYVRYDEKYKCESNFTQIKYPILSPQNEKEKENFIKSELIKNIYAYRFIQSGILDSLLYKEYPNYVKENVDLFPFIDSLLPNMDCSLGLNTYKYEWGIADPNLEIWGFFYPGIDYIVHPDGTVEESDVWNKYFKLRPQEYIVGYDKKRELVHFISGDDFFKSKKYLQNVEIYDYFLNNVNKRKLDPDEVKYKREQYVDDKIKAYYQVSSFTPFLQQSKVEQVTEDDDYWYFIKKENPLLTAFIEKKESPSKAIKALVYKEEICDYHIRMSKHNFEEVDIYKKENCKEKRKNVINLLFK